MVPHTPVKVTVPGIWFIAICATLSCLPALAQSQNPGASRAVASTNDARLTHEVSNAILSAPTLSIFDHVEYQVRGGEVYLRGQVVSDTTKHDIDDNVKHIEGITNVVDQIEELPSAPGDQQIRRAEYRAIYGDPALEKYALGALPPIHIVVERGHVTLEGAVDNPMDKQIANQRALSVTAAFSVTNHLQVRHP